MKFGWKSFFETVKKLSKKTKKYKPTGIVCISRGGLVAGLLFSKMLKKPLGVICASIINNGKGKWLKIGELSTAKNLGKKVLLVDCTVDRGQTITAVKHVLESKGFNVKTVAIGVHNKSRFVPDFFAVRYSKQMVYPWSLKFLKKVRKNVR